MTAPSAAPAPGTHPDDAPPQPASAGHADGHLNRMRFGPFQLIRRLHEGSMGALFEALDVSTGTHLALKVLPKSLAEDEELLARFKREVATLSVLRHPNIVSFYGSYQFLGYHCFTMELINGESLAKRLAREGRLPEAEALRIAREVALGLAYAHEHGVIHRDIKPENILLTRDGTAKISDFGLAKTAQEDSRLTSAGMSVGTPYYISPEQALGGQNVDQRADLYGLGATLFHLLTGRVPFDHPSATQVMVMHVQHPPLDPRSLVPGISRGTAQLVLRLMSKAPKDRLADAGELARSLERLANPALHLQAEAAQAVGPRAGARRLAGFKRWRRDPVVRTFFWLALLGLAAAAGLAIGAFWPR